MWIAPLGLLFERYLLISIAVRPPAARGAPGAAPRAVGMADLQRLVASNPRWSEGELRRRLEEGQAGFLWESSGRVAHCRWISAGECFLPYLKSRFRPGRGRVLSMEAFTAPDVRRGGLYRRSLEHLLDEASRRGADEVLLFVAWWHRATRAALRDVEGATRIGSATRLLGRRRTDGRLIEVAPGVLGVDGAEA